MSTSRDQQLVKMADQIATNIGARLTPEAATARTVDHINRFWTTDMKRRLVLEVGMGTVDVSETILAVVEQVNEPS